MNFLQASALTFLATAVIATAAAPRFALVRVKDIYAALPSTTALQQTVKTQREDILRDQRAEELRTIIGELSALREQISDKAKPLDEATNRQLSRTYEIKRQEAQTLQQEFENFKEKREKEINRKMVAAMRASLDRIAKASAKIAKERGFHAVFDSTGETNTGQPFVLYHKEAPDLTADIQAALRATEPPPVAEPPTAKPVVVPPVDHGAGHYD